MFQILHTAFSGEQLDADLSPSQLYKNNVSCEQCLRRTSCCGILRGGDRVGIVLGIKFGDLGVGIC